MYNTSCPWRRVQEETEEEEDDGEEDEEEQEKAEKYRRFTAAVTACDSGVRRVVRRRSTGRKA